MRRTVEHGRTFVRGQIVAPKSTGIMYTITQIGRLSVTTVNTSTGYTTVFRGDERDELVVVV
jgi:hypothetical protein